MGISKIAIFFVILGLATCGADRCVEHEVTQVLDACGTTLDHYLEGIADDDEKAACSGLETYKTCMAVAVKGCGDELTSVVIQVLDPFKILDSECRKLGYSHASSTSVANVALLIAAVATLVPFV